MSEQRDEPPRVVTATELLDFREREWAPRLRRVSLAAEVPVRDDFRKQTLECLGKVYRKQHGDEDRARVLRRWPAAHVLSTTGVATDHYVGGTFWPSLVDGVGVQGGQAFQAEWGQAFLANLTRLGLPTFDDDDAGTKYVGRILMHSGMPTMCLYDFFRLITERRQQVAGLSPDDLIGWVAAREAQGQPLAIARPVARFLRHGGEFAADVIDRVFDLLDVVADGRNGADVPLPGRFCAVAAELLATGELRAARRSASRAASDADQQPRLVLDPFGLGPLLRLPGVGDAPDGRATWIVGLDADSRMVPTRALDPGLHEPAPATEVALPHPVRVATVALAGREDLTVTMTVINDADPLLAFGEDGARLPPGRPLPGRPTWLLFPGTVDELRAPGASMLTESPLPPGWAGWSLVLADLQGCASVRAGDAMPSHPVRSSAAARIIAEEPLRGVRTTGGLPVVATLPSVQLPGATGDADWEVVLLNGDGERVARWTSDDDDPEPDSIWNAVPRPVVGAFTVRVRGPWGRGATRAVMVVEGLHTSFSPPWRRFVAGGLQPVRARLAVAEGVSLARPELGLSEREMEQHLRVGAHGSFVTLVITPPHMSVAHQTATATTTPSTRPLSLFREELTDDPGKLILHVGEAADPTLCVLTSSGVVQEVAPGAGRHGVYQFDLARIHDTLTMHPQVRLSLDPEGELLVGRVRPQSLFSGIELVEGSLEFADCVEAEGLTALVYAVRAPWRGPRALPVVGGRVELPEALCCAGPLRVLVRIEDPWVPEEAPAWPAIGRSALVDNEGHVTDGDPDETALSAWLAGTGEPPTVLDLTRLWTIRGLLGGLALDDRAGAVAQYIESAVHADPRPALVALSGSGVPDRAIASLVVRTGLAWADLRAAHDDEPPIWTGRGALPAALISAADLAWSDAEVAAAVDVCGAVVADLADGRDPAAACGRLDDSADLFDRLPAMRDEFVRRAGLVPKGLLSGDARIVAAMDFVKERHHPDLEFLVRNAHKILSEADRLLGMVNDPRATAAFDARRHPTRDGGWRVIPSLSLALALAARHAARGHRAAQGWVTARQRVWGDLARVAPQLVTIDLVVAELLVASASRPTPPVPEEPTA